ncbi:riboflavin kinase-domain-containing protein [Kockovaella imperatae]|uniref:Riboflavin kinase n=1 Tax=Kockovaella imperatae TaxID=4999 RepID=A0A1Y1U9D3_9TREE|nr:riboflavin kinase-domain-containing protein [Kockovaella imperatae]ORX34116.1 riboflavin kinase-domain-containing protein [Kockovaella imperatae]
MSGSNAAPMAPISRETRPSIVGGDEPESPYPIQLRGSVTKGFGRGARELGIPTANLPDSSLPPLNDLHLTGIFYGFARVHSSPSTSKSVSGYMASAPERSQDEPSTTLSPETISSLPSRTAPYPPAADAEPPAAEPKTLSAEDSRVWPMVMSVGWNPYYKNEKITAEVHILHPFAHNFYGHDMSVLVTGYIRPELDYVSKEALIEDINTDARVALNSLARPAYAALASDPFLAPSSK